MNLTERFNEMDQAARLNVGYFIAAILALAIGYSAVNDRIARLEKKRVSRQADLAEMMLLKQKHREASAGAQKLANRLSAVTPDDSVARLIDEIGIKGKNSQIKPLKGDDRPGFMEDAAEVRIEGLSANEVVNLLFRLEKGVKPVVIKKANFKTRYDDPGKLDVNLNVALLKPVPQEKR